MAVEEQGDLLAASPETLRQHRGRPGRAVSSSVTLSCSRRSASRLSTV
ncbi:hypothetical protein [Amycolatopsis sp. BJA-103]|nr:hypothetical protein [Amycolatopsis sp. BJA-103]